ncbi:MAG: SIMPL domain-containing protein [Defluviitaleaceae bacterium]|nr:SIMPL domain-containing protein [Defluviitaleaceae bacterium]
MLKDKIKTIATFGLVAVVAIVGVIVFAPARAEITQADAAAPMQTVVESNLPTVTVAGVGSISVTPDIATVSLGVENSNVDAQAAITQNNTTVNAVIAALTAMGISEDDISTQRFSIHQQWGSGGRVIGHTVNNTINVTVRDLDNVGYVIGAGVAAGANRSGGVWFSVEDSSSVYLQALAVAVADAAAKGDAIAGALGSSVATVVSVTETNTWAAPTSWGSFDMGVAMAEMSYDRQNVPIHADDLTITARVEVIYAINR